MTRPAAQARRQPPGAAEATQVALGATERPTDAPRRPQTAVAGSGKPPGRRTAVGAPADEPGASQTLVLDGFPSVAQVKVLGPNGGVSVFGIHRARKRVHERVTLEVGRQRIHPIKATVMVTLRYVMPDDRARDVDNFAVIAKPVIDGLVRSGVLTGDDYRRVRSRVEFVKERGQRRLEVILEPLPAPGTEGE